MIGNGIEQGGWNVANRDRGETYRVETALSGMPTIPDIQCEEHSLEGALLCARALFESGEHKWVRVVHEDTDEIVKRFGSRCP